MSPNTWYYTLSTISQALAAILGLAAVFVVLRLQLLIKNVSDYRSRGIDILSKKKKNFRDYIVPVNLSTNLIINDLEEIQDNFSAKYSHNSGFVAGVSMLSMNYEPNKKMDILDFVANTSGELCKYVEQRDETINLIKWPGITVSTTISLSVLCLSLTDILISWQIFVILVSFFLYSMWKIISSCWKILVNFKKIE